MGALSSTEHRATEQASAEPMLAQVEAWAAVNSGTANLAGLEAMADLLADAFSGLHGELKLEDPAAVEAVDADGLGRFVEPNKGVFMTHKDGTAGIATDD